MYLNKSGFISVGVAGMLVAFTSDVNAAPKFGRGTAIAGVIAYQDHEDESQFHYLPGRTDALLGERITNFTVTHFGIGESYFVQSSTGEISSRVGAIVSGTINFDISDDQRQQITAAIKSEFGVENPKLLPLALRNVKVESTALDKTLSFEEGLEQNLPSTLQLGTDQNFSIGTLNSGFGHIAAGQQTGGDITPNSHFGINVAADVEFVGDPWTAEIKCDLQKVWEQVRTKVSASVSAGWFRLGSASYSKVHQELEESGACDFNMIEGSLDTEEYGRQVMDMTKKIFEEINRAATDGTGFFKFDTNYPQADPINTGGGGSRGLFGFSVSVSGGYSSAYFKQSKIWETTISYTGRFEAPVAMGTVLAVKCSTETKQLFTDLNDAQNGCVDQAKADALKARLKREGAAKAQKYFELEEKLALGQINNEQYDKLKALYDRISLTEFAEGFRTLNVAKAEAVGLPELAQQAVVSFGLSPQSLARLEQEALQ